MESQQLSPLERSKDEQSFHNVYAKISQEYQKIQGLHVRNQEELKNHLLQQKKNERYLERFEEKLREIERREREMRADIE